MHVNVFLSHECVFAKFSYDIAWLAARIAITKYKSMSVYTISKGLVWLKKC